MAWVTPSNQSVGYEVGATDWNQDVVANTKALKTPPSSMYTADESSDYTTSSTSFVDVDATNFALTITTTGGAVLVVFQGSVNNSGGSTYLDVAVDTVRDAGDDGIVRISGSNVGGDGFVWRVEGLAAGSHTFTLQWKVSAGTATLYAGAGTAASDVHPQFWVAEVS